MNEFIALCLPTLVPLYSAPKRYYHNLDHINFCLGQLEWACGQKELKGASYKAVETAIWFHDAIYNPYAQLVSKNYSEVESADLFDRMVDQLDAGNKFLWLNRTANLIARLISITANHLGNPLMWWDKDEDEDEELAAQLMLDIDLASLGIDYDSFSYNTNQVCKEYRTNDVEYSEQHCQVIYGNAEFLKRLLAKPRIYYTQTFFDRYEQKARENLTQRIKEVQFLKDNHG